MQINSKSTETPNVETPPRPTIDRPVVVEGKYDKIKLTSIFDAHVFTTDGFRIFNDKSKLSLLRSLACEGKGIILLTDSDGAGLVIRNYLRSSLGSQAKIVHLYIPEVKGKERRKAVPSAAGTVGVEGIAADRLRSILAPYTASETDSVDFPGDVPDDVPSPAEAEPMRQLTKADLYADGFSGTSQSAEKRRLLCSMMGIPTNLSANAMTEAINLLGGYEMYKELLAVIESHE